MTQCIMRITNPIDQDRIASSVESVGRDLLRELPSPVSYTHLDVYKRQV